MKKIVAVFLCFCLISSFCFSQESEDFFEDEFSELFEDAEDVDASQVQSQAASSSVIYTGNPNIRLSGHFDGDLGGGFDFSQESPFGYLNFNNNLYLTIWPSDVFQLRGTFNTSFKNKFIFDLSSFYLDYKPFDFLFLTAGIKGISWGYTRLFSDADANKSNEFTAPFYTNVLANSSDYFIGQLRFPWRYGTFTAIGLCDYNSINDEIPALSTLGYAFSSEFNVPHFCFNLFGRLYAKTDSQSYKAFDGSIYTDRQNPLAGVETKVSAGGWDMYAQGIMKIKQSSIYNKEKNDVSGSGKSVAFFEKAVVTAGFYKLWDKFDPNFGINVEYQYDLSTGFDSYYAVHRVAGQLGVKRLGKNKNLKFALDVNHNFTENIGQISGSFLIGGIFPYANWQNTVTAKYGNGLSTPQILFATLISISLDY